MGRVKEQLLDLEIYDVLQTLSNNIFNFYNIDVKEINKLGIVLERENISFTFEASDIVDIQSNVIQIKVDISPITKKIYTIPFNRILYTFVELRSAK